jgi:hypothetical protein
LNQKVKERVGGSCSTEEEGDGELVNKINKKMQPMTSLQIKIVGDVTEY